MDKNVLKKFAIESRQELMEKVANKINRYFIDEEFNVNQNGEVYVLVNDKHTLRLTKSEYENRQLLVKRIKEITLEQVIEEAAYTWFNRIIAIRYMEIHDYLPLTKDNQSLGVRVLSSKDNSPDPEIMKISNLLNPDLDIGFDKEYYGTIQDNNKRFEYILLLVCKKLGKVIPQVFDGITDYIDILVPDNLLNESGYINKLLQDVAEDNFNEVEIVGWLYQFYISEKKDIVFSELKKSKKISKENIPAATQLFTPDWIVKYLVENSLGRKLISLEPSLKNELKYYIDVEENESVKNINEIKFLDPCCGSGHILVYAFELFYKFYNKLGYDKNSICKMILKNNIFGMDLDERACQLSILSLLLKARKYDKYIFNYAKELNILSIQESNKIQSISFDELKNDDTAEMVEYIQEVFKDAKEYGTIIDVKKYDYNIIRDKANQINNLLSVEISTKIVPLIEQATLLSEKYDIVVTNPPYMGNKGMSEKLFNYIKKYYNDSKIDMFSVFIEKCRKFTKENGIYAMITQPSFVTLSSFEKLRTKIIDEQFILTMIHMGRGVFGVDFGSVAFVIKNTLSNDKKGVYFRLFQRTFQYIDLLDIEKIFINAKENANYKFNFYKYNNSEIDEESPLNLSIKIRFNANQVDFKKIPTNPFAYWCTKSVLSSFEKNKLVDYATPRQGLATTDNNKFLRFWYEINYHMCNFNCQNTQEAYESGYKWFPIVKGGDYRKWYGNRYYVVDYYNDGEEMKQNVLKKYPYLKTPNFVIKNPDFYFKPGITWSTISSKNISMRINPSGSIFETKGAVMFPYKEENTYYLLGLLNSKVADSIFDILCPTMDFHEGPVGNFPVIIDDTIKNEINELVKENIEIMKADWDSNEISWDFKKNKCINKNYSYIKDIILEEQKNRQEVRNKLKENEQKINELFIKIYGLENEINPNVADEDLSIKEFDILQEIKDLISYAVGCMFGRYSLDVDNLVFAGGDFNKNNRSSFEVDADNIIPIMEDNYFGDDIVSRFKKFIEVVYGKESLYDNLEFIAETLGKRNVENCEQTIRRYFINDFYNEHVKMYQKRPIYWMFDSGKKNGFKCLIYMHRYNEGIVSKVRLDYLHRIQNTYEKELKDISDRLNSDVDLSIQRELSKRQADISAKLQETNEYDEKIAHIADQKIKINLDDGVAENYSKFSVKNPKTNKDESILAKL